MYLALCHPSDILDLSGEQLQYIPKIVLLHVYGDYIDNGIIYDCLNEHTHTQFWATLGLVLHNQYECQPFIVAVYSRNSKPQSVNEYLHDFVEEASFLVQNVITIGQRVLKVEIIGISCDTPARSFIKKCKGHGGFYACERCETRGSFRRQRQKEHHLEGKSPLLDIPYFDPVKSVFLDSMHLLYLGIMKWILQQLLGTKKKINRKCILHHRDVKLFNSILKVLLRYVPKEFQRKTLDLDEFNHWKATQYRFFLHYCGTLVLQKILPKKMYQHFLLLVVACRVLCDPDLCLKHTDYARKLLRKFFELLPSFYGSDSQIMNNHNLIHLADDVEFTKLSLSEFSAFPFENKLGKIKRKIRGKKNSVAQLIRRESEERACS
ncbi:hypothetical protein ALC60_00982 [Trachymyrmex zeteki]|uniref:Transposase domain-containing protein n=1 Tax=Mycetomoellerius zeteki TaxID=64791 RepID=A0A151XHU6_9HYME|nr:hypothetical protein ALC60_00982 [Trachymyrmex zeteki]